MLGQLLGPDIQELIEQRDFRALRASLADWPPPEIADLIESLPSEKDVIVFRLLPRDLATEVFEFLDYEKQARLIEALAKEQSRLVRLLNELSPDDRTALLEELPGEVSKRLLSLLAPEERRVALALLGYPEESVGRLMTPDYVAVYPTWTVQQALDHIRLFGKDSETLNVIYVVNESGHLLDDLRIREILLADPQGPVADLMDNRFVALKATDDQEAAVPIFRNYGRIALPVTDTRGVLIGIVTVDDVLEVAEEEATEDFHKIGGTEALDEPYIRTPLGKLVQKRAKWLVVLFIGELLTASAMGYFEAEIARAVVLVLFVPLIISSGGNSGSQAATLVIRALAVRELGLHDWWRVMRREVFSGLALGAILGGLGVARVLAWEQMFGLYGEHSLGIALTVGLALLGVVMWGTIIGSMLPFIMQRLGADPATSSAPFVATLVDVFGVLIYFSLAALILRGSLL
ncbi:MAG: magnesium transporter [Desulfuromonadales bacterium]|nr:magnesium transporter [Desulfuromonadales bacterium]